MAATGGGLRRARRAAGGCGSPRCLAAPVLLLLAAIPVAAEPVDTGRITLSATTEAQWVPFDLTPGNQIRFTAILDGKPVVAILDTGVSYSVLARRSPAVDVARLHPGGKATAIGGAVAIEWMPTTSLAFGGLTRLGGRIAVTPLPAFATGSAQAVDLLVGRDLIADEALDIDYAQRRFRLLPSGRLPFTGATAPLAISSTRHVYESMIALGATRLAPIIVDTGDGASVTVTATGWQASGLAALPTTTALSYGIAGPVTLTLAVVPSLTLGDLVARNVEVRVEPAGGFSQAIGTAGRLGSGFLQNYRVLLDPTAGRMVLSPGPKADQPPLRSTSGLLVGLAGDRLRVIHVMRGSPAAATGWRDGETICRVNGRPIAADYATSPLAAWSVSAPGTLVTLGLCDGTERSLRLAAFY